MLVGGLSSFCKCFVVNFEMYSVKTHKSKKLTVVTQMLFYNSTTE